MTMNKNGREVARHIAHLALAHGVACSFETGGKHPKAIFVRNGKQRKFAFAGTPGDHRGWLNALSDIREIFRDMDWPKLPEKEETMSYNMIEHGKAGDRNASQGPAGPVKVIPPPKPETAMAAALMSAGAVPNFRGIPLIHIPPAGRIKYGRGMSAKPPKTPEYKAFIEARYQFIAEAMRTRAFPREDIFALIAEALTRAGHDISRSGVYQAWTKNRDHPIEPKTPKMAGVPKPVVEEPLPDVGAVSDVDKIVLTITGLLWELVKAARRSDTNKDARIAKLERQVEAFRVAMDLVKDD